MFFLTLCLLFIIRLRFPTGKSIAEIFKVGDIKKNNAHSQCLFHVVQEIQEIELDC